MPRYLTPSPPLLQGCEGVALSRLEHTPLTRIDSVTFTDNLAEPAIYEKLEELGGGWDVTWPTRGGCNRASALGACPCCRAATSPRPSPPGRREDDKAGVGDKIEALLKNLGASEDKKTPKHILIRSWKPTTDLPSG